MSNSISIPVTIATIPRSLEHADALLAPSRWPSSQAKSTCMYEKDNDNAVIPYAAKVTTAWKVHKLL